MSQALPTPVTTHRPETPPVDEYAPPPGATELSLWIAVVLIAVMFIAGCIGYAAVRMHNPIPITVPMIFWPSTLVLNLSSAVLCYALLSDRANHRKAEGRGMLVTLLLAITFLVLQVPGLMQIIASHEEAITTRYGIYAAMLVLVSLHAAHAIVGIGALIVVTRRIYRYPEISHQPSIHRVSIYWHGLTIIWVVMFSLLVLMR